MAKQKRKKEKVPGLKKRLEAKSTKKRIKQGIKRAKKDREERLKNWTTPDSWETIVIFVFKMESEGYTYKEKRKICNNLQIAGGFATYKLLRRAVYLTRLLHCGPVPPWYLREDGYPPREVRKYRGYE